MKKTNKEYVIIDGIKYSLHYPQPPGDYINIHRILSKDLKCN